ncbi:sensor histidine kinase [Paenibacillus andongensis]|uniref:sensor histidine kinase n=1 Tax=Paenibacillus andongensis TaxID=2975482 RepID=UPI0021BAD114|nr:histidine kinase [Paenibacillus andongensis]
MLKNYKTFITLNLLVLVSTICILGMYTYSINTSLNIVQSDIQSSNLNQVQAAVNNLDRNVEQLDMLAVSIDKDRLVALLPSMDIMDSYDQVRLIGDLSNKLTYQSLSEGWTNHVGIWSPIIHQWIGTSITGLKAPPARNATEWMLDSASNVFVKEKVEQDFTIQITFPKDNLTKLLDDSKQQDKNDPFFYKQGMSLIMNSSSDLTRTQNLIQALAGGIRSDSGTEIVNLQDNKYLVNYVKSQKLGLYMIDYMPLGLALNPIVKTKKLFYLSCAVLFAAGIVIVSSLYRKFQIPMLELLKGVRLLKNGDFKARIRRRTNNEFDFLYANFNEMAAQIEELIEKVYKEKIISREAVLKQLQAQINPHFLYNCLFFINNSVRLGHDEAITAMTQNLAEYFRYTTRLEEPMTTVQKEMAVVNKYLAIQKLRMDRLHYEIRIPDSMNGLIIPKLLIQPLVENSIIHGIEKKQSAGKVIVTGTETDIGYRITVEDDGRGMTEDEIRTLKLKIKQPLDDTMGCALWNIQQRLGIHFSKFSGMEFGHSSLGGLSISLYWGNLENSEG